jgi:hypothetical protein
MGESFEMRGSLARHVLTVVGGATLFTLAIGASRIVRRVASGETSVVPAVLLVWLIVAVGAALVALVLPRPAVSLDGQNLLLLGLPGRRKAFRLAEIAGVTGTGGWPRLTVTLRSGRRISYSLFAFPPRERHRLLQALAAVAPG